jgi:quercetin dioxygenase-like cupin family protein
MKITYPHTIENCIGEKLIFKSVEQTPKGEKVIVENFVEPDCGPIMHTHLLQDESLTVKSGKLGYQILGEEEHFANPGETVLFERGTPHRFWNAGEETLHCEGWVMPADNIVYFLDKIYAAQNKTGGSEPDKFDGAFLLTRYKKEYDMPEILGFVKSVIFPITVFIGKLTGKYKHFEDAPQPVKN